MKKVFMSLVIGLVLLGGWTFEATASEPDTTHTVLVEFGTTTW